MKKTQEIIGLPIISISDGTEVGKVENLIINADKGAVDYVVVNNGTQVLSASVIPAEKIIGIGSYAMTIENIGAISDISKLPAAVDWLQKNIHVKKTKVLTKKGRLIGETGDIFIDEDTCKIAALEFIADATTKAVCILPRESVITFGKNLLVVIEEVEATLVDAIEQLNSTGEEKKNPLMAEEVQSQEISSVPPVEAADNVLWLEEAAQGLGQPEASGAAGLFEQRQKQYLKGRKVTKSILDGSGNVIASEGTVITDEIVEAAKIHGKLIELVMNNQA